MHEEQKGQSQDVWLGDKVVRRERFLGERCSKLRVEACRDRLREDSRNNGVKMRG